THSLPALSTLPRTHLRSTLFPYTTLFRSRALGWLGISGRAQRRRYPPAGAHSASGGRVRRAAHRASVQAGGSARHLARDHVAGRDRKSTRLNSSHVKISYAVFCLKKKKIE